MSNIEQELERTIEWNIFKDKDSIKNFIGEYVAFYINDKTNELSFIKESNNKFVLRRYYEKEDLVGYDINSTKEFDTITNLMEFLREVNMDHATHYEYKELSKGIIKEIYKNKKLDIEDILG